MAKDKGQAFKSVFANAARKYRSYLPYLPGTSTREARRGRPNGQETTPRQDHTMTTDSTRAQGRKREPPLTNLYLRVIKEYNYFNAVYILFV